MNLRRRSRRVYSPFPLATRAPTQDGETTSGIRLDRSSDGGKVARHAEFRRGVRGGRAGGPQRGRPGQPRDRQPLRLQGHRLVDRAGRRRDHACTRSTEDRLEALRPVLEEKLVRRKVSLKALDYGKVEEASGATVRQVASIEAGISSDKARELNKFIKGLGLKGIQSQTQGEQLRVTGKKRDDLQAVIARLKEKDFGVPLQFTELPGLSLHRAGRGDISSPNLGFGNEAIQCCHSRSRRRRMRSSVGGWVEEVGELHLLAGQRVDDVGLRVRRVDVHRHGLDALLELRRAPGPAARRRRSGGRRCGRPRTRGCGSAPSAGTSRRSAPGWPGPACRGCCRRGRGRRHRTWRPTWPSGPGT